MLVTFMNEDVLLAGIWHQRSRGVWKGARKHSTHVGIMCLSPGGTMGPFANRSILPVLSPSREEYVTGSLFGTESG